MFEAVPAPAQRESGQMPDFRYAERNFAQGRFFLPGAQQSQHSQSQHRQSDVTVT
jgi:hypothetical protein